jgi:hypothetical protein
MVLELDVLLKSTDYVRVNYAVLFGKPAMKIVLFFGAILLLLSVYTWATNPQEVPWAGFILPGILLLLSINVLIAALRSFSSNKSLQQEIHYSFSEAGITAASPSSNSYTDWDNIRSAVETKNDFLLFISRNQTCVIPKRSFTDKEQIGSFKTLLKSRLPTKANLRNPSTVT